MFLRLPTWTTRASWYTRTADRDVHARNRLCALGKTALGVTPENLLDKLLNPSMGLSTSTPGADPAGDYAWAVFARAETAHPGTQVILQQKAMQLVAVRTARRSFPVAEPRKASSSRIAPK